MKLKKSALFMATALLWGSATFVAAQDAKTTNFEYPLGKIKNGDQVHEVKATFDKEIIKDFDYEYKPPLIQSINLYDPKNNVLLQTIELEDYNTDAEPHWPKLIDLNFDGYNDLSLVISRGTLGEFYAYWLYNPETGLFEEAIFEDVLPVNADIDPEHKQIVSSANVRHAYLSNVLIQHWEGNRLVTTDSSSGYYLPIKLNGEIRYCEVVTFYDDKNGTIDYSAKVETLANNQIKLHGELPLTEEQSGDYYLCYDDADQARDLLDYGQIIIWEKDGDKLVPKETQAITNWVQSKDEQGQLINEWCPQIPYVDLDNNTISTFVLDYPSEQTELKQCQLENPMNKNKGLK